MQIDLTSGPVTKTILRFSAPLILGNLLQQVYNIADTIIVGKFVGAGALAAVGASFTLMVFLTSVILGLCMGSGIVFSILFGAKDYNCLKNSFFVSFLFVGLVSVAINLLVVWQTENIMSLMQIPAEIRSETEQYLEVIFYGIMLTFVYNYFASLLRALGNSATPLVFLAVTAVLNIILDLVLILYFDMGVAGAAWATVISQAASAIGLTWYSFARIPLLKLGTNHLKFRLSILKMITGYSLLTCVQQSIMNFGILMVQGLINSFGVVVMAAFAAAVKIDALAYMPVQDFGNGFSTFIAQNFGAGRKERIREGIVSAVKTSLVFCLFISSVVYFFARELMLVFVDARDEEIIEIGEQYLQIEGMCYFGIGWLFLFYGFYRGIGKPGISVVLTVVSLGTRVILAYALAPVPSIGLLGVWWSIPVGWFLADALGVWYYRCCRPHIS